jgi:hypothetical protein
MTSLIQWKPGTGVLLGTATPSPKLTQHSVCRLSILHLARLVPTGGTPACDPAHSTLGSRPAQRVISKATCDLPNHAL